MDAIPEQPPQPPLPPLTLHIAKRISVIVAGKYLAETAILDARMSDATTLAAQALLALTTGIRATSSLLVPREEFEDIIIKTVDACVALASAVEEDVRQFTHNPEGEIGDDLIIFYKSLVLSLADVFPGKIPVPSGISPDDFYALVSENRARLLQTAGLKYTNQPMSDGAA